MASPLVSVLMPVRNEAGRVTRSVRSILDQTYRHFELIVIDDASTDSTTDELRAIEDERLRVLHSPQRLGLARQLNAAAKVANGELLARQDGDDFSLPERFSRQVACYLGATERVAVVATDFWMSGEPDDLCVRVRLSEGAVPRALYALSNPLAHGSLMFSRECFERVGGYDERLRTAQDLELLLRLAATGTVKCVDEPLYLHNIRKGNATARRAGTDIVNRIRIARTALRHGRGQTSMPAIAKGVLRHAWRVALGMAVSRDSLHELKMGLLYQTAGATELARHRYEAAVRSCPWNLAAIQQLRRASGQG